MQGKKHYTEKLFANFQLSERVPADNFYRRLKETLDIGFVQKETEHLYGSTGNPGIDPVVFFKLMLVGYLENISSDRRLIDFSNMRLDVMYFLNYDIDEQLPWHSTVSRTRQLYGETLFEAIFSRVFALCVEKGMVGGHTQAIDSAYIKANASMDSIEVKQLSQSLSEFVKITHNENYTPLRPSKQDKASDKQKTLTATEQELKEINTRNKRFKAIKEEQHGATASNFISFSNKTHYSPTDPDARISTKPGKPRQLNYLCNLSVDTAHGVITHVQADYADVRDSRYLSELVDKTKTELENNNLQFTDAIADTGYTSASNYHHLEQQHITPWIPTSGKYKNEREGFTYNKEKDLFICPNNKEVKFKKQFTTPDGQEKKQYRTRIKDCRDCPLKHTCLGKVAKEKKIEISFYQEEMERAYQRQHSARGKRMMKVRAGTVEPVFGTLINYYGLRKINVKGKAGAHKCMIMAAIAYNIKKLMKFLSKKAQSAVQSLPLPSEKNGLLTQGSILSTFFSIAAVIKRNRTEKYFLQYQLP